MPMTKDNFLVKRIGKRAIIVEHPAATPQFYGVENPDEFFGQPKEEQRKQAIKRMYDAMDVLKSDPDVVAAIHRDAERAGVVGPRPATEDKD